MTCSRCRCAMREARGTHHKQRKWRCPQCGRVRMQAQRPKAGSSRRQRRAEPRSHGR